MSSSNENTIVPLYSQTSTQGTDLAELFVQRDISGERTVLSKFMIKNNVDASLASDILTELPSGAFMAGEFMHRLMTRQAPARFDIYFTSPQAMMQTIGRIHNAPETAFLHGYESTSSLREMSAHKEAYITFVKSGSPDIKLHRARWFDSLEDVLDKMELTIDQFVTDREFNVVTTERFMRDSQYKIVRIHRPIFKLGTGLRVQRLMSDRYRWESDMFDSYFREELLKKAKKHLAAAAKAAEKKGILAVENVGDYGAYLCE